MGEKSGGLQVSCNLTADRIKGGEADFALVHLERKKQGKPPSSLLMPILGLKLLLDGCYQVLRVSTLHSNECLLVLDVLNLQTNVYYQLFNE